MKKITFSLVIFLVLTIVFLVPSFAKAEEHVGEIYLFMGDGGYILTHGEVSEKVDSEDALLPLLSDGVTVYCDNVVFNTELYIDKELRFAGGITARKGIRIGQGGHLTLSDATLTLSGSESLILDGGCLSILDSSISKSEGTVLLLNSEASLFTFESGYITGGGAMPAVVIHSGTAELVGGIIENSKGIAVENHASVSLGKSILFRSGAFDIVTDTPISLMAEGEYYAGGGRIKYSSLFEEGTSTDVFYNATPQAASAISFYDADNMREYLEFFESKGDKSGVLSVHKPFEVKLSASGGVTDIINALAGETIQLPDLPEKTGYTPRAWCTSPSGEGVIGNRITVHSDLSLYASYTLSAPEFILDSKSYVYDGAQHKLELDSLSHPCEEYGFYTYRWVDESGSVVSETSYLAYTDVIDSGKYKCILTFHLGQDSVTVHTPYVELTIAKRGIALPSAESEVYTGKALYPRIEPSPYYTLSLGEYIDAGVYFITAKLTDSLNNCFLECNDSEYDIRFEITKAQNAWIGGITVYDVYIGAENSFSAKSQFGIPYFVFSDSLLGEYTTAFPSVEGVYYAKAVVGGCDNYESLSSETIAFRVLADIPVSLSLASPPFLSEYSAFDYLVRDGLELCVVYSGGRREEIGADEVSIFYQKDNCFRYGDNAFFAEYCGIRISVPVTVRKAEYDFEIFLPEAVFVFDGSYKTYPITTSLPIGKDGIPLTVKITGGGSEAGEYPISVVFQSESLDYVLPTPVYTKLIIESKKVNVIWENADFVYNGEWTCPKAYYTDCWGATVRLSVNGGGITAGGYTALAFSEDKNYELINDTISFYIAKANYDLTGVSWSNNSFIYDGEEKRVFIIGLPDGVTAVGYTNNRAVSAGKYIASAVLDYDYVNYNQPQAPDLIWYIERADYDMSGVSFVGGERIYSGEYHYPLLDGDIPVGMDGISLSFSFSRGVMNVGDNPYVIISFSTESVNYNVPDMLVVEIKVIPMEITVTWDSLSFVYSSSPITPIAYAAECELRVVGEGVNAGSYRAECFSLDPNYAVANSTVTFVIEKAENVWLSPIAMGTVYFGYSPQPEISAYYGTAEFRYYSDPECKIEADVKDVGIYYVLAFVSESENYRELVLPPYEFSVIPIIPVGIAVTLADRTYHAFETLYHEDFVVFTVNNDGSNTGIDSSLVDVIYESGGTLLAKDKYVKFRFGDFEFECKITVSRAVFCVSDVRWCGIDTVYDGMKKSPTLTGLPQGLTLLSVSGADECGAGEYHLTPIFEYDTDNYEPPCIPNGVLIIRKKVISPSLIGSAVYNGEEQYPIPDSDLYAPSSSVGYRDAGEYTVEFTLTDSDNYTFDGETCATFTIHPASVSVQLNKIDVYLFEDAVGCGYSVTDGEVFFSDDLMLEYEYDGEIVRAVAKNPNYKVSVSDGVIEYIAKPTPEVGRALLLCVLLSVILILILFAGVKHRDRIVDVLVDVRARGTFLSARSDGGYLTSPIPSLGSSDMAGIDSARADELISNSMARTLIRRNNEKVSTSGTRRAIINLDTLSESFESGAVVDINVLKEKGLVPTDTYYLKVLSRGRLDKPLKIYANAYSISAVKMIALMGGEVNRVTTERIKGRKEK